MNPLTLAAIALQAVGTFTSYSDCFRASDLRTYFKQEGMVSAGKFESGGGERFELWTDGKGKYVVTMTAPPMRGAECVVADGAEPKTI